MVKGIFDNPTATWGGLIGFMMGVNAIEEAFGTELSNEFHIHRTRQNFPNNGIDTFENMAENGLKIVDSVVLNEMNGSINQNRNYWIIPFNRDNN